jgi:ribosome-associated protein
MTKTKAHTSFSPLVHEIVKGIDDLKGENVVVLNLSKLENAVCDYFVICEGNSTTQVSAIAASVEKKVRENTGEKPWHIEGTTHAEWVLLDYVSVAVHVFQRDVRAFYDLESLWADATVSTIEN